MTSKKTVDISGLSPTRLRDLSNSRSWSKDGEFRGIANQKMIEPVPEHNISGSETVYSSDNNSAIVLGRDRPSSLMSGYGGKGHSQAGSIDLVVGRGAPYVFESDEQGNKLLRDPDFRSDAARIHISQKTDIDDNFGLADGKTGNAKIRSGIGIKADNVRVIGRESIKLITKTEFINSQGGQIITIKGIDLIAGNDDSDLQSIPKGQNLARALSKLTDHISQLTNIVETILTTQMKMNNVLMTHTHLAPGAPSIEALAGGIISNIETVSKTIMKLPLHRMNLEAYKINYLSPVGRYYINSRFNHTN